MAASSAVFFVRRNWKIGTGIGAMSLLVSTVFAGTQGVGPLKDIVPNSAADAPLISAAPVETAPDNTEAFTPASSGYTYTPPVMYPTWDDLKPEQLVPPTENTDNAGENPGNNGGKDPDSPDTDDPGTDNPGTDNPDTPGGTDNDPSTGPVKETVDSVTNEVKDATVNTPLEPVNEVVEEVTEPLTPAITQADAVALCVAELSPALKAAVNKMGTLDPAKIASAIASTPVVGGPAQAASFTQCVEKVLAGGAPSLAAAPAPAPTSSLEQQSSLEELIAPLAILTPVFAF